MWLGAPQAKVRTISGEGGIKVSETVLSHGTLQDWSPPPPPPPPTPLSLRSAAPASVFGGPEHSVLVPRDRKRGHKASR